MSHFYVFCIVLFFQSATKKRDRPTHTIFPTSSYGKQTVKDGPMKSDA